MNVAKSYANCPIEGEPFVVDGRKYVNVKLKNGKIKSVRVYSDAEYAQMYAAPAIVRNESKHVSQKLVLGFAEGYVTIFRNGGMDEENAYFKYNPYNYCRLWGWYWPSDKPLPNDLPEDCDPVKLPWNVVGKSDGQLKSDEEAAAAINQFLYPTSSFFGSIGQRIELTLTVMQNIPLENKFGHSFLHKMEDEEGHIFVWITASKNWPVGTIHHLRGTIKEQKIYNGEYQTILSRCLEK